MKPSPFKSDSQAKEKALEGENKRLYEHLEARNTINFLQAKDM
jgi:hypothetical protein